jgi:hypothetical protein
MSEDLIWNVLLLALLVSLVTTVYLWFFKRQRSGTWIWISYSIRAAWGGFLVAIAHMSWTILKGDIPLDAVAAFVVPILMVGVTFLVPWGLLLRRPAF